MATTSQPMVITHEGGARFAAQVRAHQVVVDQTERGGGGDTAPTPIELLGASLGTCIALYVQRFLLVRALPFEGMRVEVTQEVARNPARIAAFDVHVVLPTPIPAEHGDMLERVARSCPVHNTLAHSTEVHVTIDMPEESITNR